MNMQMTRPTAPEVRERLDSLDGMRGAAALAVVVYHFFARWAEPLNEVTLYPHGNILFYLPGLAYLADFGILLFFIISGFVIMMTLEHSSGFPDFVGRRVARLWPAMLVCATFSTLIINGSGIAFHYPGLARWEVTLLEYISSIFFLPPEHVSALLGRSPAQWVEGVYWTLWVEVRFYALIALTFLLSSRSWFVWIWAALQALSTVLDAAHTIDPGLGQRLGVLNLILQPKYLAWFSLGLCGYLLWSGRCTTLVLGIILLAVIAIGMGELLTLRNGAPSLTPAALNLTVVYGLVCTLFVLFVIRSRIVAMLNWRPLVVIGLASYPLYLFHELPGMAALKYASELGLPPWLGVSLAISAVIATALLVHKLVESPAKRAIIGFWRPRAWALERRFAWLRFSSDSAASSVPG